MPVDREPLADGMVTVAEGRIVAVGENASGLPPRELGDVALLPGFVNAHTHLEFSSLKEPLGQPGMPFPDWIQAVIDWRRSVLTQQFQQPQETLKRRMEAILWGLAVSRAYGVAAVGEIGTRSFPPFHCDALGGWGPHCTVFYEVLGLEPKRASDLLVTASEFLAGRRESFVRGLSPHAPYTVGLALLDQVCRLAAERDVPLAMHLAESRAELELLASHSGPLMELLRALDAWHPSAVPMGTRPLEYLRALSGVRRSLVIHGNYLTDEEICFLAAQRERMSLIYCPRTHAYFGHDKYPLAKMLAASVHVAIGTDSLASNPDLDVFSELLHIAADHSDVSPEEILRLGTIRGAEALGIADQFGTIAPGKWAALAMVPIDPQVRDPYEALFDLENKELSAMVVYTDEDRETLKQLEPWS
ncbi:MAG: amidohydrolase family protein [Pirellulaceae bacterium]|nr:amidohydrolase family protein [Pirellulaceae bacterium]